MSQLHFKVYSPDEKAIFKVTSTIIYGDTDAYLVDAQFQKHYAEEVVKEIKALGKNLKLVYISHFDPDYYFGLDVIHAAFPEAKIVSTAQTAWMISASKDDKLTVWKDQLGGDAPVELIVPEAVKELPPLEGNEIRIIRTRDDETHSFLYVPSEKTVLGGVSLSENVHPWMADTKGLDGLDKWIRQVESMKALAPAHVIPSHDQAATCDTHILDCTIEYLKAYRDAVASGKTASAIIAIMKEKFPELGGLPSLEFGAKVITGEAPWAVKTLYPGVEHHVTADFTPTVFELDFKDNHIMSFLQTAGEGKGYTDTMPYTAIETAPNVFMVYWQEENGIAVCHVQNWNTMDVWTNIYIPGQKGIHMKGHLILKD